MALFLAPEVAPANEAFAAGRYAEAATLYEQAAYSAHRAGDLLAIKMGANLAVKAWAYAGDGATAARFAMSVVDLLKTMGREPDIRGVASKALESLRAQGHLADAAALSAHVGASITGWHDPNAPQLPAFCTHCGAPVRPDEVLRPTPVTFACKFCGGSLAR
jgi:hypothetical protein